MNLPAMREQKKVILAGVPGIGVVHDYNRLAVDFGKMLNLFKDADGRINGCMFAREKTAKRLATIGGAPQEKAHVFLIRAIMGLKDDQATGIIFDELLTAIEEKFEDYYDLNGTCLTTIPDWGPMAGQAGVQIDLIEERMFGNVLCHYAEMRLCALEYES
jgi:hypothetical protein